MWTEHKYRDGWQTVEVYNEIYDPAGVRLPPDPVGFFDRAMEKKSKKKGVFVPEEILKDKRLTANDKFLLSYYRYCTERMEKHCCIQTNGDVAEFLGMSEKTFERSKHHLKELGLIDTDGGIKTWSVTKGYRQNDGGGYPQNGGA